jgi:hypothetical protein
MLALRREGNSKEMQKEEKSWGRIRTTSPLVRDRRGGKCEGGKEGRLARGGKNEQIGG